MIDVVSYNCNSIRNNIDIVKSFFVENDIVMLQELMLEKRDLDILNDFNKDFRHVAFVKDREMDDICEGRPSRGVAIFWRNNLSVMISPVFVNDFIIGIIFKSKCFNVLILNVYMPCNLQNIESLENYRESLAMLEIVIKEQNVNHVIIGGDMNADPKKGKFWTLLREFTESLSLHILDNAFPKDTFTYLCPAKNTTSWLDHIICSTELINKISYAKVDYDLALYDHFPISFALNIPTHYMYANDSDRVKCDYIKWDKMTAKDREMIRNFIDNEIAKRKLPDCQVLNCFNPSCTSDFHKKELDEVFNENRCILLQSTEHFRFVKERKFVIIPGWNDHVRQFHKTARNCFLLWKDNGRPLFGGLYEDMKASRAKFKEALNECKRNEINVRNEKLVENFKIKAMKCFWGEVANANKHNLPAPENIDGKYKAIDVCALFSDKYRKIFNKDKKDSHLVKVKLTEKKRIELIMLINFDDIKNNVKLMRDTVGYDNIHTKHFMFNSDMLNELIAKMYTSFIVHNYIPADMIRGVITPIIKDKLGDCTSSSNYRPIMISSVYLKLFEYCILSKIEPFFSLNDRQHGFRKNHSTSTACFTLKETILYYLNANSTVFAGFVDIKKKHFIQKI